MKNGLVNENGTLIYYENDKPKHAGVVRIDDDIYYAGKNGVIRKGRYVIHSSMSNDILDHGTYTFDENGKLIKDSYVPPEKRVRRKKSLLSKKGSEKNKRRFNYRPFVAVVMVAVVIAFLFFIVKMAEHQMDEYEKLKNDTENSTQSSTVILPEFNDEVLLCSKSAKMVYDGKMSADDLESYDLYAPLTFNYNISSDGMLILSESPDLSNPRTFILSDKETRILIDNLKTGTQYYYKVTVEGKDYPGEFKTAKSTRFISIPGLYNTRDIGGYTTLDGKMIKQGMIIRGTEADGLVEPMYYLKDENVEMCRELFGFVCDLDLRANVSFTNDYKSRFGNDVKHTFYTAPSYTSIFNESFKGSLYNIFSELAKPENYPMYMHCTYGADRTGTIVFLLDGILNVEDGDMQNRYALTKGKTTDYLNPIYGTLKNYKGDTTQQQIVDFLISYVGITEQQIESIRSILLEDVK